MTKTTKRKYSYTWMLALSFLLAAAAWKAGYLNIPGTEYAEEEELMEAGSSEEGNAPGQEQDEARENPAEEPPAPELPMGQEPEGVPEETAEQPLLFTADITYFDDALFIGDSRTVGLKEYGGLGNAEVLADSGMSVYKVFQKTFPLRSGEKMRLEELLESRQFGKIYIMLGINELGYDFEATVKRYGRMVERIQELQPDAVLFLEANLHISRKKSETSDIYNNQNIDRFNQAVEALADGEQRFYLDVNELFDDEGGNLADEYTADEAHVLGKYYKDWVDWILERAVRMASEK